jgi:hypothetical protein
MYVYGSNIVVFVIVRIFGGLKFARKGIEILWNGKLQVDALDVLEIHSKGPQFIPLHFSKEIRIVL